MPADALVILGSSASVGMVLAPKAGIFRLHHQRSQHGLPLIPALMSNHIPSKLWDGIADPFPSFNHATVKVWEWICNSITHFIMELITYPCWDES